MSEPNGSNLVQLFLNAGPTAKAVLVVLAFFSLV